MRNFLLGLAVCGALLAPVGAAPDPHSTVSQIVREHFQEWDLNHNGVLDGDELDKWMREPSIHGREAAALAALKAQSRQSKKRKAWLASRETLDEYDGALATGRTPPRKLDTVYHNMLSRLEHASRELYAPGAPHLAAIRQVSGGDCYFLSAVLAMLARNPRDVKALIQPEPGGYLVQFPNCPPHHVAAPTDALMALYTDDRGDGQWLYVLLMAFGEERMRTNRRFADVDDPGDVADTGGSVGYAMKVLDGHGGRVAGIGPFGGDAKQRWVRQELPVALGQHKLVALGTGKAGPGRHMPKGITNGHIMAVIGYDAARDEVIIRNPWGNTLTPAEPGPRQGYPTKDGVFRLSVPEVCRYYTGMIVEW